MFKTRIIPLLFFLFLLLPKAYSQSETLSKKEISKLVKQADRYLKEADFENSLIISKQALSQAIAIDDKEILAASYNIIAANYYELLELDKAILFYNKGLSYANQTDNDTLKNKLYNNLGNLYFFEKKQYQNGLSFYKKSLEYAEKMADTSQIIFNKINISWAYFDIADFKDGYPYLKYINKYHTKYGSSSTIVALKMLNGMYYGYKGEDTKADASFRNAIQLGNEGKEKSDLSFSYQEYSKFLLKKGDYKRAYGNLVLYNTTKEELYNDGKLHKASIAGIDLQLDEYKRQVDRIETRNELQAQSIEKSKIIFGLFIAIFCFLLLLLYTLFKNNNFRKKTNKELLLANEQLILAKEKAEEASLLKTQFVSTISHELRTPLYGVVGITNMILEEHKELAKSPHLNSLKFSARYLLSLVNDILQINKMEENRIVLEKLTFNIPDELNMISNSLQFLANKNQNSIQVLADPSLPEFLIGDKLRLAQILMNLASNALKFTKKGRVIIQANLIKVQEKSHYIEFQIIDNGEGIAAIDQEKIFDKFVQISRKQDDYQGTGLGLSIVKKLIELFDSHIIIESKLGEGTTFKFVIAFEMDEAKTKEIINNIRVDLSSSQRLSVLVVDDNKINQIVTKKIMEKNNFKCEVVDDGLAALELLDLNSYDLILMDINMPVIDGFETTRRIRNKGIEIPIIALTAFDKEEITEEAIASGMNDIIIKPFEPVLLFQMIYNLIHARKNLN